MNSRVGANNGQNNWRQKAVSAASMTKMDGFSLLSHIMEHYPEIPVIIITGYSTSEMERLAREGGAIGYIAKPFMIDDLAKRIITTLRKEADGGTLHSVSSGIFLQLMEMEEKTCTVRLIEKSSGKQGILFFLDGQLLDARCDSLRGEAAAYEIFSWDDVSLSIQNSCSQRERRIHRDLQAILLDAMRLNQLTVDAVHELVGGSLVNGMLALHRELPRGHHPVAARPRSRRGRRARSSRRCRS